MSAIPVSVRDFDFYRAYSQWEEVLGELLAPAIDWLSWEQYPEAIASHHGIVCRQKVGPHLSWQLSLCQAGFGGHAIVTVDAGYFGPHYDRRMDWFTQSDIDGIVSGILYARGQIRSSWNGVGLQSASFELANDNSGAIVLTQNYGRLCGEAHGIAWDKRRAAKARLPEGWS